jgi:LuxR family maltose regulon positive regulatory protein
VHGNTDRSDKEKMTANSEMDTQITILLADDHPVFRKGLRLLLEEEQDMKVIGEAGDGKTAIALARELSPDVIVMDITMPDFNGIEATQQIVSESPDTKVMALSIHSGKRFVEDMLRAGAIGYILKDTAPEELVSGIRTVKLGEVYLSAAITRFVVSEYKQLLSETDHIAEAIVAPIIHTKFHGPPGLMDTIPRARLKELMEKGRHTPVTLISAPAGYGKSILASQWLEECDSSSAWLALDDTACPKTEALLKPENLPPQSVLSTSLINELDEIDQPFTLVLDDYHRIHAQAVHEVLSELLRNPPRDMHIIFATRRDPPLPLVSLRAQQRVMEIRVKDLRFTNEETAIFLQDMLGRDVDQSTAAVWTEKTEGWVTGLRLAALSMRHREDIDTLTLEAPGNVQYVTEYLFSEVLSLQPSQVRQYLLDTAILDRFCAPLIKAVCGPDAAPAGDKLDPWDFIAFLLKENLFIVKLDAENKWFRYHHLFQRLLENQLKRARSHDEIASLHSRAGAWFNKNSFIEEAIRHLLAADDSAGAAQTVNENRLLVLNSEKWYILESWLSPIPQEAKQGESGLLLAQAWVLYHKYNLSMIPPLLEEVDNLLKTEGSDSQFQAEIDYFRGHLSLMQGKGSDAEELLGRAKAELPAAHYKLRAEVELQHAQALHMLGHKDKAFRELEKLRADLSLPEHVRLNQYWAAMTCIHLVDANLVQSLEAARQLCRITKETDLSYLESWGIYFEMCSYFHQYKLEDAARLLKRLTADRYILHLRAVVDSLSASLLINYMMQEYDQAELAKELLQSFMLEINDPICNVIVTSCHARLSLLQEDVEAATRSLQTVDINLDTTTALWWLEIPRITACRVLIAKESADSLQEAVDSLQKCEMENESAHNVLHMIDVLSLLALAYKKQGRIDEALTTLRQAIKLAEPGGVIRPFIEPGPEIGDLLKGLIKENVATDFIAKILADFRKDVIEVADTVSTKAQSPFEPLTKRELEILTLLAQRHRNKEIADKLFISSETVKRHTINIYQKLGVNSRDEAVTKAEKLGILSSQ